MHCATWLAPVLGLVSPVKPHPVGGVGPVSRDGRRKGAQGKWPGARGQRPGAGVQGAGALGTGGQGAGKPHPGAAGRVPGTEAAKTAPLLGFSLDFHSTIINHALNGTQRPLNGHSTCVIYNSTGNPGGQNCSPPRFFG